MTNRDDASTFVDVLAHFDGDGKKDLFRRLLEVTVGENPTTSARPSDTQN